MESFKTPTFARLAKTYPVFSDFVSEPFVKFEVFTTRRKRSEVNDKGKRGTVQQHGERLE